MGECVYAYGCLCASINKLQLANHRSIIIGDFNLLNINWSYYSKPQEKCHDLFIDFVNDNGFHQHVLEPTRNSSILDLAECRRYFASLSVMCPFSTSDHNIIKFCFVVSNRPGSENTGNYFYDFQSADYSEMSRQLAVIDWYYEFSFLSSVEEYVDQFKTAPAPVGGGRRASPLNKIWPP